MYRVESSVSKDRRARARHVFRYVLRTVCRALGSDGKMALSMKDYRLTDEQLRRFHEDGYVMIPNLFDREQIDLLLSVAKSDRAIKNAGAMADGGGGASK